MLLPRALLVCVFSVAAARSFGAEFLYTANAISNDVSAYRIQANGSLTPLPGSPFPAGTGARSIATDPAGKFLYVVAGAPGAVGQVLAWWIDRTSGLLQPVAGSPFIAGVSPAAVTVDRTGRFVYVANGGGDVSAFAVNRETGALDPVPGSPFAAAGSPTAAMVETGGTFLYVAAGASLHAYRIDMASGALVPVVGSPFPAAQPGSLALEASGHTLIATGSLGVSAHAIGRNGEAPQGETVPLDGAAQALAAASSGTNLYVTAPGSISGFQIHDGSHLTRVFGATFSTGPRPVAAVSSGKLLYVGNEGVNASTPGSVYAYRVESSGNLTAVGTPVAAGFGLRAMAVVKPVSLLASWIRMFPPAVPRARHDYMMASNPEHGYVLLFGGNPGSHGALNDTWIWNGTTWTELFPSHAPPARHSSSMVYHDALGQMVLFGGDTGVAMYLADTWTWNGSDWIPASPAASPPLRGVFSLAYDWARRRTVLFGGSNRSGQLSDTWLWDGANWAQSVTSLHPGARCCTATAYDEARRNVVIFGGMSGPEALSETWTWSGSAWARRYPARSPTFTGSMTYGTAIGRPILFGRGATASETWTWDGSNWSPMFTSPNPPSRGGCSISYDPAHRQVVMFGGNLYDDAWVLHLPEVRIAVRPENAGSGVLPMAILSTPTFDAAAQVDRASLTFGRTGDERSLISCSPGGGSVDSGGQRVDALRCNFRVAAMGLTGGEAPILLKGRTTDNVPFYGELR